MRKIFWLPLLLSVMPLWAQKNLLPAAGRAASWKPSVPMVRGETWGKPMAAGRILSAPEIQISLGLFPPVGMTSDTQLLLPVSEKAKTLLPQNSWTSRGFKLKPLSGTQATQLQNELRRRFQERQNILLKQKNQAVKQQINELWKNVPFKIEGWALMYEVYRPLEQNTWFALQNNKMILQASQKMLEKLHWLEQRPLQGKNELEALSGDDLIARLAEQLADEKMIFLGEEHYFPNIHHAVECLLLSLQQLNPQRKIVLFTEFVDLPSGSLPPGKTWQTYYRQAPANQQLPIKKEELDNRDRVDYAPNLFKKLWQHNIEIYPLEDRELHQTLMQAQGTELQGAASLLAVALRNKSWARTLEAKMKEIRQTDPDALFVVYAGMGHTSWIIPSSLPKFFATENPAVVEISSEFTSDWNTLYPVWTENSPYLASYSEYSLFFWVGKESRLLAKQTGFDYALVVPFNKTDPAPYERYDSFEE